MVSHTKLSQIRLQPLIKKRVPCAVNSRTPNTMTLELFQQFSPALASTGSSARYRLGVNSPQSASLPSIGRLKRKAFVESIPVTSTRCFTNNAGQPCLARTTQASNILGRLPVKLEISPSTQRIFFERSLPIRTLCSSMRSQTRSSIRPINIQIISDLYNRLAICFKIYEFLEVPIIYF